LNFIWEGLLVSVGCIYDGLFLEWVFGAGGCLWVNFIRGLFCIGEGLF